LISNDIIIALLWLLSCFIATGLCSYSKQVGQWFGLLDTPNERKKHKNITPLLGGVVLQVAFLPCALLVAILTTKNTLLPTILTWLAAIAAMTLVGLADDRHSLSPRDRLLISFLVFGSVSLIDPLLNIRILYFEFVSFELGLGNNIFAVFFTILCCVGLINAVNMADGKNGLVIGLCLGWLLILASRAPVTILPFIFLLVGILIVLLFFNLKGMLFLGDGGAYGLACAVGLITIMIYNMPGTHAGRIIAVEEIISLFAIPVLDAFRLTYKRIKRGQSPMAADRDHFHHILQDRFGWPRGLIVYWIAALGPAIFICISM
jgi:UDP-GlcNAc:undecaprenyl-phosphate/decaprenyl-phosphate GlcNAc-1-phosphate transferase